MDSKSNKNRRKKKEKAAQAISDAVRGTQGVEGCVAEDNSGKEGVIGGISDGVDHRQVGEVHENTSLSTHSQGSEASRLLSKPLPNKSSFEEELEWCVAQLELGMLGTGASKSQKQQNQRSLQTLQNSKTALPKKRQIMRSLFGDYRSKMKTQPIPDNPTPKLKATKSPKEIKTVGTYYRHHTHTQGVTNETYEGSEDFKFNFTV
jgi:hypothetical protein